MRACHYSNSPNLVISFDYSWFLAKNLSILYPSFENSTSGIGIMHFFNNSRDVWMNMKNVLFGREKVFATRNPNSCTFSVENPVGLVVLNHVSNFQTFLNFSNKYRHSSISAVLISAIFDLKRFIILSYFPPLWYY